MPSPDLHQLLKTYWGYTEFRSKQESIVRSILEGRDVAVVMPTGGGKSLCYQLPAVALDRTCVVVSPLIALMQDQSAQLREAGIPAASLNSSFDPSAQSSIMRRASQGEFRLLYLSPERLVRPDMLSWLNTLPLAFFAIDEAHCISEWGHEFRPEYRQLRALRQWFPDTPIAAFTASATRAVRHDIVTQLQLREPRKFVMSFHRPNLRYIVHACAPRQQPRLLHAALRHYDEGAVIVYAPTIRSVEETAAAIDAMGIPAVVYHGQMEASARRRNQEAWMEGEQRVLVGTVAFGLGINKPDVRAVIHLSMPKSIEQYYQEAGRAGRDGEPADCVLLWQKRDVGLLTHFVQDIQDPEERDRAWSRYRAIRRFVESSRCRHREVCLHFGETPAWETCGACDACGASLDWLSAPASEPAPAKRSAPASRAPAARASEPPSAPAPPASGSLRDRLRHWRLSEARRLGIPAYVILHDATIDALCRQTPSSIDALCEVPGIGRKKAERFGERILEIIAAS